MAVALYVTGISTPEVHPEFPPRPGTLTNLNADFEGLCLLMASEQPTDETALRATGG
jgi:hypothetical protein